MPLSELSWSYSLPDDLAPLGSEVLRWPERRAMDDAGDLQKMRSLLLSYVGLIAGRNGFAPGENFEYRLWDTLHGRFEDTDYVTLEEGEELIMLAVKTDCWVTYNDENRMWELIPRDEWEQLLAKRRN
jgi:hypothetical protein